MKYFFFTFFPLTQCFSHPTLKKSSTAAEHFHVFVWQTAPIRVSWQTTREICPSACCGFVKKIWSKFNSQCNKKRITSQIEVDSHANYVSVTAHVHMTKAVITTVDFLRSIHHHRIVCASIQLLPMTSSRMVSCITTTSQVNFCIISCACSFPKKDETCMQSSDSTIITPKRRKK